MDREPKAHAYDVVGDVHGCFEELCLLLEQLGYERDGERVVPPPGRKAVFVGDLIDRGPRIPEVVALVTRMVADESALCVLGNHEHQLLEQRAGRAQIAWGLRETLEQYDELAPEALETLVEFSRALPLRLDLDEGRLLVTHAGLPEDLQRAPSPEAQRFALYGSRDGARRIEWASSYRGAARVVYGHTPCTTPAWVHGTLCLDTGCVYGGALSALRYPELELASVPAQRAWYAQD